MIPAIRKKVVLRSMRERKVPDIVAEGSHPQHSSPIRQLIRRGKFLNAIPKRVSYVSLVSYDIKYPTGKLHDSERVFESSMGRSRINEIGQGKLVYMA